MRGIVTLASALSLPRTLSDHTHFPFLALMVCTAFSVILFTLLIQGLSLRGLIRYLGVSNPTTEDAQDKELTVWLASQVLTYIQKKYSKHPLLCHQRKTYERLSRLMNEVQPEVLTSDLAFQTTYRRLEQEIVTIKRGELKRLRSQNLFSAALIRQPRFR